mgnify:FL=1
MKKIYATLAGVLLALLLIVGAASLFTTGQDVQKPAFTIQALLDGSFISQLETYYTETFPLRQTLLQANRWMNGFYHASSGGDNILVLDGNTGAEQGGESLARQEYEQNGQTLENEQDEAQQAAGPAEISDASTDPKTDTPQNPQGEQTGGEDTQTPDDAPQDTLPELDNPDLSEAQYAGNVVIVGDRAMEIPTATNSVIESYAQTVNALSDALGSDVRTISLVTPNGGEFYSPESMHTGLNSQKDMIDYCYSQMKKDIVTVDAYSALRAHTDEYIFFRTDHHWTQLGAYYAYTAFCEAAGFEAVPLEDFETGRYDRFVGSMYTFTANYPQSQTLLDNPDYLEYYLPIATTHAKYYTDGNLQDGVPVSVVYQHLDASVTNKYQCFIGGDTPVCVIETDVEGPVCLMLKESYGNAFAPFLTSHYSKIIVVDPREFNRDGKPSLDLTTFAKEQGVNDLLVLNYPYMINNSYYIAWLGRLVGYSS